MAVILVASAGCILAGGLAALIRGRAFSACLILRAVMVPAALLGLAAACALLWRGETQSAFLPFPLPLGRCLFRVDPLSAFFLIPVFLLSALAALVLPARVRPVEEDLHCGRHCFFFSLLSAGMALVLMAADGIFFLLLWELMSLAPFFLLASNDKNSTERFAGWIYLVAAHLGALPLLLLFASMSMQAGSSDFAAYAAQPLWLHGGALFALAVLGFGTKCGLFPLHMWMPEAHSSAPGHVAVLLSGTMLNVGLYGILRLLCLLGAGQEQAYALIILGGFSGIMGILAGLVQSDMKRVLAYSSAENMGIVLLALGGALLAAGHGAAPAATLLLCGALLHIWNHSVFKSLLFLGANAVKERTHVTGIHRLGGLFKRIPFTGGCFATGCAAIAGIPPLNGFMGEMLIYLGFLLGAEGARGDEAALVFWVAFFILATIAGFALFTFARLFGLAFLGAPRSAESLEAREPERQLKAAMLFLALICPGISLAGPLLMRPFSSLLSFFKSSGLAFPLSSEGADFVQSALGGYAVAALGLAALLGLALLLRSRAVRKTGSREGLTWGCGYSAPSPRMQYTGGSFAHSASLLLRPVIRPRLDQPEVRALFPGEQKAVMLTPDWPTALWGRLLFRPVALLAEQAKNLQHGLLNVYILYILVALMAALVWALGRT